jgi:hypothetical protein
MKQCIPICTIFLFIFLFSCTKNNFFQVYKVTPISKISVKQSELVYDDDNCKIIYNLWEDGGNIGFVFYNKTDKNIYLNLDESFFVLNGVANNYYKSRTFTSSSSLGATSSRSTSASKSVTGVNVYGLIQTNRISATSTIGVIESEGFSVSYLEERIICIPAKTSKSIAEYKINGSLFRNCELLRFPLPRQAKTIKLTKTESPMVFSNRLSYSFGRNDVLIKVQNEFYVSEITNYPEREMYTKQYEESCGKRSLKPVLYFSHESADKFYLKYTKGSDASKY